MMMMMNKSKRATEISENPPRPVHVMIEFSRIGEIDTMNEKYQAEVHIESKWSDNELITEYDPKKHWNPKLFIENIMHEPKEQIRYEIQKDINNDGVTITEIRHIKGVFWERLELQNFPVDVQELSVILTTKRGPHEIQLIKDEKKTSYINSDATHTFIDQQKWRLFKLVDIKNVASYDMGSTSTLNENSSEVADKLESLAFKSPKIVATTYCSRRPGFYFFNAYFLIFLITISSLTIFSVDCKLPQNRLQTTYTLLLTSVSFKWVINRSLPTVSYLTSLDKYAIVCIFYVCLLCVWHALVGSTFWDKDLAKNLDQWLLIAFSALFLLIHVVLGVWIFIAYSEIRSLKRREKKFILEYKKNSRDQPTYVFIKEQLGNAGGPIMRETTRV